MALFTILLLAVPAHAASSPMITVVTGSDPDSNTAFSDMRAAIGYQDVNGNGRVDASNPSEPVYVDLDNSGTLTVGDLQFPGGNPH